MILTKSSKPVPVMTIGVVFYGRVYGWYKYASVALLCGGIYLFTQGKKSEPSSSGAGDIKLVLFGMLLVLINLAMDGYTNNEQDRIFAKYKASPNQMMKYTNLWQCLYQFVYLLGGYLAYADGSELSMAVKLCSHSAQLVADILLFCLCASLGQVLIFNVMQEFGSLSWITISVTRKLFTVVLSVIVFQHKVNAVQWLGVALVFVGLGLDAGMSYVNRPKTVAVSASKVAGKKD
jgi:UDP-galactose transporter B1